VWEIRWGRAVAISWLFAALFGAVAGAAFMGGLLVLVGHDWLRPVVAVREMPNFDTEAEALSYWRLTHNRALPLPPAAIRTWRWRLGSGGESRR
jgi:hypothetical protein